MSLSRLISMLMLAVLLQGGFPALADDAGPGQRFTGARTEIYKTIGDVKLAIHRFEPEGHQPTDQRPAIVCFFGGGWKGGNPRQFEQHCRYLATRGIVAMTADYRVSSRHGTKAKECVQDGKSAIRWVRTNASRLGIDPQRIVACGGSAGGHVAACTAVIEGLEEPGEATTISSVPNALVLFNPVMALAPVEGTLSGARDRIDGLRERLGTDPEALSPVHHIRPGLPPSILFFGTEDDLAQGAKAFERKAHEADVRCELRMYDGQRHGFFNYGRSQNRYFVETLTSADQFLGSLGYVDGSPTVAAWLKQAATQNR